MLLVETKALQLKITIDIFIFNSDNPLCNEQCCTIFARYCRRNIADMGA